MFTSDDRGILFSKSLERHLFDGHRKSDFTNITSLRGVYLTNKLDHGIDFLAFIFFYSPADFLILFCLFLPFQLV